MTGSFLWRVDDNAVFAYGEDTNYGSDYPLFFTITATQWEEMGKPETISIMVTPA